jgi:membrane fusion protein, multidrug efflux system
MPRLDPRPHGDAAPPASRPVLARAAVGLLLVALLAACGKAPPAPEPERAVRTLVLAGAPASVDRSFAAEVKARTESRLAFRVGGLMRKRLVDVGARVKAGQVLAVLDPSDLQLGQEAARSAVQAAEVQYEQARADHARFKELHAQGFISAAELERRDTTLRAARAQLDQARAQAGVQGNQARYASLVAEAAGIVTAVDAEPGAVLAAGTPVLRLAHDGPRDVVFAVPEDSVEEMRELIGRAGALSVRPWGDGATPVPATVREVAAAADPATRTFQVKADVGRAALALGQTATVVLTRGSADPVLKLPLPAVVNAQGRNAVWVLDRATMTVNTVPVTIAGAVGNELVVAEGLQPGQTVVTAGVHLLQPGQKVRLYAGTGAAQAATAAASGASR